MFQPRPFSGLVKHRLMLMALVALLLSTAAGGQTVAKQPPVDQKTIEQLMSRIDQLEARVKQLESSREESGGRTVISATPTTADPAMPRSTETEQAAAALQSAAHPAPAPESTPSESAMMERMDVGRTLLRIRGFGDLSLHGDTLPGDTTSFSLGQLDLFITSDISERFRFLSEIVFEGGPDNIYGTTTGEQNAFGVDVERYLLQYSHNDFVNISAGRGHTAIGYYNTAYHHSSWLQTTTDRPFLFQFEDRGGILPVHMVGLSASGEIPSGSLGLHYVAEVGNGRASRQPFVEDPVQNEIDDQNHKAFNLALFARPEGVHGLQTGFSFYRDLLAPASSPRIGESIFAAHAIMIRPHWEWLSEALLDRHTVIGTSSVFNTPGFYSQVSKQFRAYRPYFRYQYINVANNEPVYADVALRHGPSAGLRYDANESVALKFQYDYTFLRNQAGVNGLTGQVGFTF
jgi:hypothetical protein